MLSGNAFREFPALSTNGCGDCSPRPMGYSLQANQKTKEGATHPDRNAQFEFINARTKKELAAGNPVISVDTKKKELVGDFKNRGRTYRPKGDPEKVRVHDFSIPELGRANPYGVYDLAHNMGWVSVGTEHDTAAFAVETIRRWWKSMGAELYPKAQVLANHGRWRRQQWFAGAVVES
jgi:hypothetical protein